MKTSLRGELTNSSNVEERFEFTNNDMVMGVANYLNANCHDEIEQINKSLSPVLLNSVAANVSEHKATLADNTLALLGKLRAGEEVGPRRM